jgi:hypothetical protein
MLGLEALNAIGFAAGALTVMTFAQKRMVPMRLSAVGANLLFISYGLAGGFYPILVLHLLLLPINLWRLAAPLGRRMRRTTSHVRLMDEWRKSHPGHQPVA